MCTKMSNKFSLGCKSISLFLTLILAVVISSVNAQTTLYPLGAKLLSETEYEALPKVNWEILRSNVQSQATATQSSGVVMLNNPPIGNQGGQGSCTAWAVGYAAVSILAYPKFNNWNDAKRSPSYIYNQIKVYGCADGAFLTSALELAENEGVCSYTLMPYVSSDCETLPNNVQKSDASLNKVISWSTLSRNDVSGIKQALGLGYPVVVTFCVYDSFFNMWDYSGGVWTANTGTEVGGHASCIIGYDDTKQMFKVQNSWGTSGGDNGYFWVTYDLVQNNCLSEVYVLFGITIPTISGPTTLPICATATYTVSNAPAGYTWKSSSNLVPVAGSPGTFTALNTNELLKTWVGITLGGTDLRKLGVNIEKATIASSPNYAIPPTSVSYSAVSNCPSSSYKWVLSNQSNNSEVLTCEGISSVNIIYSSSLEQQGPYSLQLFVDGFLAAERMINNAANYTLHIRNCPKPIPIPAKMVVLMFPNPAVGTLHLEIDNSIPLSNNNTYRVQLCSVMTGAVALDQTVSGDSFDLDVSGVPNGNYAVVLSQDGSVVWSGNVIIQH